MWAARCPVPGALRRTPLVRMTLSRRLLTAWIRSNCRRALMLRLTVGLVVLLAQAGHAQRAPSHSTFVIVHGAWGGSWDWHLVDSLLTARGYKVYRPSL